MAEDTGILTGLNRQLAEGQGDVREPWGGVSERGELTVERILAWADAHHAAHGAWPEVSLQRGSGAVDGVRGESWRGINHALALGLRGLPGDSSLAELLAEHRGTAPLEMGTEALAKKIWAWEQEQFPLKGPKRRQSVRGYSCPPLTMDGILAWADAHHAATGAWPKRGSGPVRDAPFDVTWHAVEAALWSGRRGLPRGWTLSRVLAEYRDVKCRGRKPLLTIDQVLAWADAHRAATGRWPTASSGAVAEAPRENWANIDTLLRRGRRDLPGGLTLCRLLTQHRGHRSNAARPRLTLDQVLAWADAHHAAHGRWPTVDSGPVTAAPGEGWGAIDDALTKGNRGFCGGTTLSRLLVQHRGHRSIAARPRLSLDQILAWADAHHAAYGRWPTLDSGPVTAASGETWRAIDDALRNGNRGFCGDTTLSRLLVQHRGHRSIAARPRLTLDQILTWADAHHAAHGRWPTTKSGSVTAAPGDTWSAIAQALTKGNRGFCGGTTLARVLAAHRQARGCL